MYCNQTFGWNGKQRCPASLNRLVMVVTNSMLWRLFLLISFFEVGVTWKVEMKNNPAPDDHRCGVCPTYLQKICAFDVTRNVTYIFDNHCIMDLYNCIEGTEFVQFQYDRCLYFGNFAYVHGITYEDEDYEED